MFFEKKMVFTPFKTSFLSYLVASILVSGIFSSCKSTSSDSEERFEMDGMERAMRQQFLMTRDPALNQVPTERLLAAMRFMRNMRTTQVSNLTWSERGPNNIGGRSRTIMIDKRDASGNSVFAASVSGGIFKTTNFLSANPSWAVVNDQMANLAVTVLVQDRNNFNVMYAGTGEGWFNLDAVRGAGIFKSTDGGATWNQIPSTSGFEYVQDFVIDNNGNLYVALRNLTSSFRGVMRSTDGGTTWTQVLGLQQSDPSPCPGVTFTTGRAADLEVASNGDIYAALGIFTPTQIFKSTFATYGANTGAKCNWQEVTPPHANTTF
ncbi:MAG TPA: sialidase family protein, partial [Chitinophagaceae bacterium]|nr:sialidase family protein [Chitinophagaceae bacterium]